MEQEHKSMKKTVMMLEQQKNNPESIMSLKLSIQGHTFKRKVVSCVKCGRKLKCSEGKEIYWIL